MKKNIDSESLNAARALSEINDYVLQFNPVVLTNDSSAYFNKILYPLANQFERELRRFLYIKNALYTGDAPSGKVIADLEKKTFGEIYDTLFVDAEFCKSVKSSVGKASNFSRDELIKRIKNIKESTTWDIVIGNETLKYVKENFLNIKDFRNDIMHAHNISYEQFRNIKNVFETANSLILIELNALIKSPESVSLEEIVTALYEKMEGFKELAENVNTGTYKLVELFSNLGQLCESNIFQKLLLNDSEQQIAATQENTTIDEVENND